LGRCKGEDLKTGMDKKAIYATMQPQLKPALSASMGVEGAGTGSDSGWPEITKATEAMKSMAGRVFDK
jgi:hypothetical protein